MVGQVWTEEIGGGTRQSAAVERVTHYAKGMGAGTPCTVINWNRLDYGAATRRVWPPPGAVLVSGPGAPWAPADYAPETEGGSDAD